MKMFPPIRTALVATLADGTVAVVATDHAPHQDSEKLGADLAAAAAGSPGVETLYLACLELGRRQGDPWRAVLGGLDANFLHAHLRQESRGWDPRFQACRERVVEVYRSVLAWLRDVGDADPLST